jgi:hypothetical protein
MTCVFPNNISEIGNFGGVQRSYCSEAGDGLNK